MVIFDGSSSTGHSRLPLDCAGATPLELNVQLKLQPTLFLKSESGRNWNTLRRFTSAPCHQPCLRQNDHTRKWVSAFAPEILARIFSQLSYQSLLAVLAVSKQWSNIVTNVPALSVQMFKRFSKEYVEPGSTEATNKPWMAGKPVGGEPVRLHPALNQASYMLGDELAEVTFYIDGDNHPKLVDLAIANDFISVHAVKTFTIPTFLIGTTAVQIFLPSFLPPALLLSKSKTARASRCIHVFAEMEKETNRKIRTARHGMVTQRDLLGNHTFYEGFDTFMRTGQSLAARMRLGS